LKRKFTKNYFRYHLVKSQHGELSRSVGLKNGQRVIWHIMKKNPFPVIVSHHRVIKSNGSIGGYTFGIERKKNID